MKKFFLSFILCAAAFVLPAYASEPEPLQGVFSVSETKRVQFSAGNLQYTQSTDTWSFAEHQYDVIGTDNVTDGTALAGTIDLFGWSGSTGTAAWGISTSTDNADYSGEFSDWGQNIGDSETWRTLSKDEWKYLFQTRANASSLYGVACINLNTNGSEYANGVIILPDNWQTPDGIDFKSGSASSNGVQYYGEYQTFTLSEWEVLEASGAVFLPAAGYRTSKSLVYVRNFGYYWSSSSINSITAYPMYFNSSSPYQLANFYRYYGYSVRLVLDVYSIDFVNGDGTLLQHTDMLRGEMPAYTGETPTKEADAQYTYTFAGWDKEIEEVTGDATYTAVFTATVNTYTITFQNEDGTTLQSTAVPYGETPVYDGDTPTKPSTAQYTYTFDGWDKEIEEVTGDATYTAVFTETLNKYTITFQNGDGEILQSTAVPYGETPAYNGDTPTKPADAQYTYTFKGWDKDIAPVTENTTYTAVFTTTVNKYTITFQNGDGEILQSTAVPYGETPAYNGDTPTKPATAQYTYTFAGWDKDIAPVTGDATYTAVFTATVNKYTVTFQNEDGTTLQSTAVPYGETPVYNGETPTKPADAQYTYTFEGWDKDIAPVTGDATYTAVFTETLNTYTITFQNEDDEILQSTAVPYGETPVYDGDTPTKPATAQYTYTFDGWDKDIAPVTGDATYTAVFTATVNEYTISAEAENGTVSGEGTYAYGTEINLLATPDAGYVFTRWSDDVTDNPRTIIVTEDATYTALFTEDAPTSMDAVGTDPTPRAQKVLRNGQVLILRDGKAYDLLGQEVR